MNLELIFAAGLVATFLAWYACSLIPGQSPRGIVRAAIIAVLCSPGIIVGHGFAVVPGLFALYVQPSIWTLGLMLLAWVIVLAIIFGVPGLRNHRSAWPPSGEEIFLRAYALKFVFFGLVAAMLMAALINHGSSRVWWVIALKYGLFFVGAAVNLTLCYQATRMKRAAPLLTPIFFAAPVGLVTALTVPFMWYGGGAIGGLVASGRERIAAWIAVSVFGLLSANAVLRVYLAATAQPHVTIGGGVAGNALMASVFAGVGIVAWWVLHRHARARPTTTPR